MGLFNAVVGWFAGGPNEGRSQVRSEPHPRADVYKKALLGARAAYVADDSSDPINKATYKVLLGAYSQLVAQVRVPDACDSDFRRNLPAGGWRGMEVPDTMAERIQDVHEYLEKHHVYALGGQSVIDNLLACVDLSTSRVDLDALFAPILPTLAKIQAGNIR